MDVNAQRQDHWTPLDLASIRGRPDIVQVLLEHGAKADMVDNFFRTTLHHVSGAPYESPKDGVRVAQLLLENGADVHAYDINRESPLHVVTSFGKLEMARLFLNRATVKNIRGENPSHLELKGESCIQINLYLANTFPSARRGCECPQERSLDSVTSCLSLRESRGRTFTS